MNKYIAFASLLALILTTGANAFPFRTAPPSAQAIAASGAWDVSPSPGAPFKRGRLWMRIKPGGAVRTCEGTVRIMLPGGTSLEIAPHTTMGLPILYQSQARLGRTEIVAQASILKGAVRLRERSRPSRFIEISTPVSVVGVRGTDFVVAYNGKDADVTVFDGEVMVDPTPYIDPTADADGDGIPNFVDADIDGDGSPNTSDPEPADPAVAGAKEVGYDEAASSLKGADAVEVDEDEQVEIEPGVAPDVEPIPEDVIEEKMENWDEWETPEKPPATAEEAAPEAAN